MRRRTGGGRLLDRNGARFRRIGLEPRRPGGPRQSGGTRIETCDVSLSSLSPNPMCAQVNNEAHRGERQPDAAADQDGAGGAPEQAGAGGLHEQARPSPAATPQAVSGDIATTRPNWLDCRSGRLPLRSIRADARDELDELLAFLRITSVSPLNQGSPLCQARPWRNPAWFTAGGVSFVRTYACFIRNWRRGMRTGAAVTAWRQPSPGC